MLDDYKKIGLYGEPTNLYCVFFKDDLEKNELVIVHKNKIVDGEIEKDGKFIMIESKKIERFMFENAEKNIIEALKKTPISGGKHSNRKVYIDDYVFKTSTKGLSDLKAIVPECSRNLHVFSHNAPIAYPLGVVKHKDHYYYVEEKLDVQQTNELYCKASAYRFKKIKKYKSFYFEYESKYKILIEKMKKLNIGGDFKLDNIGFRNKTKSLLFFDVINFPMDKSNPYGYNKWSNYENRLKIESHNISKFNNPYTRLYNWYFVNFEKECEKTIKNSNSKNNSNKNKTRKNMK
jgi:hypothetical protein